MSVTKAWAVGILLFVAVLSGHLCAYLWRGRKSSRSAIDVSSLMAACAWWAFFNALEYLAPGLSAKIALANIQYAAIAAIPVFWFKVGRGIDREERRLAPPRTAAWIWILPAISSAMAWTDPWLGLMRHSFSLELQGGFIALAKEFGAWFWVHSAYSYVFIALGTFYVFRGITKRRGRRLGQSAALILGALLPVAANLLFISGIWPLKAVDPTPLALATTAILLIVNLSGFRFLALGPVASGAALEQMGDPVLILDRAGALAMVNRAAREAFGLSALDAGKPLSGLGPILAPLIFLKPGEEVGLSDLPAEGRRLYEARAGTVERGGRAIGLAITLRDVTAKAAAEDALRAANREWERKVDERTQALEECKMRISAELEGRLRSERQLYQDALHDPLTGLANRSLLLSRLDQAIARSRRDAASTFGLLYLDFDGFKGVNDDYGHDFGDAFLREVGARMKRYLREVDTVARVGSDEFVILLDGDEEAADVERVAERIQDELSVPFALGPHSAVPSASIGILEGKADYGSADEALRDADIAMHGAKAAGKNRRLLFAGEMRSLATERSRLLSDLRAAIAGAGIGLAFQPIVRMDGRVVGWEALARWKHPELGPIGPDRFIPLAEESGLIIPLGTFVLIETLKVATALRDAKMIGEGPEGWPFFSVNVSAIQLGQADFAEIVLRAVDRAGLPRSMLHLELTESAFFANREAASAALSLLSEAGIAIKLDDFGTGYSSLGYLDRIPIDCVKIDKSFIDKAVPGPGAGGVPAAAGAPGLVKGIISLAHELGKTVVAEGIETEAQAKALTEFGCDFAQGYYYGKPADAEALRASLRPKG